MQAAGIGRTASACRSACRRSATQARAGKLQGWEHGRHPGGARARRDQRHGVAAVYEVLLARGCAGSLTKGQLTVATGTWNNWNFQKSFLPYRQEVVECFCARVRDEAVSGQESARIPPVWRVFHAVLVELPHGGELPPTSTELCRRRLSTWGIAFVTLFAACRLLTLANIGRCG